MLSLLNSTYETTQLQKVDKLAHLDLTQIKMVTEPDDFGENNDLNDLITLKSHRLPNLPTDSLMTSLGADSPYPSLNKSRSRIDSDYLSLMVKRGKTKVVFAGDELIETVDTSSGSDRAP